jgi:hypothetical protein
MIPRKPIVGNNINIEAKEKVVFGQQIRALKVLERRNARNTTS